MVCAIRHAKPGCYAIIPDHIVTAPVWHVNGGDYRRTSVPLAAYRVAIRPAIPTDDLVLAC